jgi:peptidoglycan/xylan/chitin deacetylase (PgdA/CDA1 family)
MAVQTLSTQTEAPVIAQVIAPVESRTSLAQRLSPSRGILRSVFRSRQALRILCYHGVIADELAGAPWVPDYFVTQSQFREQMRVVRSFAQTVRLADFYGEAPSRGKTAMPQIAITFDDVPACTFAYARPVMKELGISATFYVSTGLVTSRRMPAAEIVQLLRAYPQMKKNASSPALEEMCRQPNAHKTLSIETLQRILSRVDGQVLTKAPREAIHALKPLSWLQLKMLSDEGHEVGGHTVDHAILSRQTKATRARQVAKCFEDIRERLRIEPVGFAYPNGGPGDFDTSDGEALEQSGFKYAVTTEAGFCTKTSPRFALPRVCIGMGHTRMRFMLEISGLLDKRRRRQQGWI